MMVHQGYDIYLWYQATMRGKRTNYQYIYELWFNMKKFGNFCYLNYI
jgi:hypothetical protein